jgi:hypothetical protein
MPMMRCLTSSVFVLAMMSATALAQPKLDETMSLSPTDWPKLQWTLGAPSANDAAGRVVIHWFCTPKVSACADDLARIVTLRENGGVYIIGYIDGSARDAKKLDPIRESEGVGRGTLAYGPGVKKLFKQLGIAKGPYSIVVDVDDKVKAVTTSGDLNELDARDAMARQLVEAVKTHVATSDGPKSGKAGQRLTFTLKIQLARWLSYSKRAPMEMTLTAAKEIKCDATTLKGDQLKIEDKVLTASVTCTAPKGSYQVRGDLRFGYESPTGAQGLGAESATWKFDVTH